MERQSIGGLLLALGVLAGCGTVAKESPNPWPNISFIISEDTPDVFEFSPGRKIEPTVNRVVLLPVVENYLWKGKRHFLALADPIVVEPGKESLRSTWAALETDRQAVRSCIVLAPGYCPGTMQPVVIYAGNYEGKDAWLVLLAKVTPQQYQASVQCITNDLNTPKLRVQGESQVTFEDALKAGKLLNNAELKSPVVHSDGKFRKTYVLWSVQDRSKVSICLSSNGWNVLNREIVEPAFRTP